MLNQLRNISVNNCQNYFLFRTYGPSNILDDSAVYKYFVPNGTKNICKALLFFYIGLRHLKIIL